MFGKELVKDTTANKANRKIKHSEGGWEDVQERKYTHSMITWLIWRTFNITISMLNTSDYFWQKWEITSKADVCRLFFWETWLWKGGEFREKKHNGMKAFPTWSYDSPFLVLWAVIHCQSILCNNFSNSVRQADFISLLLYIGKKKLFRAEKCIWTEWITE